MIEALLFCTVVGISDGDTLTARCSRRPGESTLDQVETLKVRLAEIDAPEKAQAFGQRAKQHLSALCYQRPAEVIPQARPDRYGRTIAHVRCAGQDANAAQVRAGFAWVYTRYAPKASPLHALQRDAMDAHRGLWSGEAAVPPWDWRRHRQLDSQVARP
jgi:endonuclease YncB( thermonuclease family)